MRARLTVFSATEPWLEPEPELGPIRGNGTRQLIALIREGPTPVQAQAPF